MDSSAWPFALLEDYAGVPTIVFHHEALYSDGTKLSMRYGADSKNVSIWDLFVEVMPHVLMSFKRRLPSSRRFHPCRIASYALVS